MLNFHLVYENTINIFKENDNLSKACIKTGFNKGRRYIEFYLNRFKGNFTIGFETNDEKIKVNFIIDHKTILKLESYKEPKENNEPKKEDDLEIGVDKLKDILIEYADVKAKAKAKA